MLEFIDRLIDRWEGSHSTQLSREESFKMLRANLQTIAKEMSGQILLTGDVPMEILKELQEGLEIPGVHLTHGKSVCSSPETVNLLADCEGVVLVARKGQNTKEEIERQHGRLQESGKELLGYIMV